MANPTHSPKSGDTVCTPCNHLATVQKVDNTHADLMWFDAYTGHYQTARMPLKLLRKVHEPAKA